MALAAFLLSVAGALCVYLCAPHQAWLSQPWPAFTRWLGAGLLVASLASWTQAVQPLAAVFTWATWLMLLFIVLPYLGALTRVLRTRAPEAGRG